MLFAMPRARSVWVVTFPGAEVLDVTGPWEVLCHANEVLGRRVYEPLLVAPLPGRLATRHGLVLDGARTLHAAERRGLPSLLIVAGGSPLRALPAPEAKFVAWAQRRRREIELWASICTGAFVLGEAGLLDGQRATTHWRWTAELRARFPKTTVTDDSIYECSAHVWTSAGVTAGIDMMLALVEREHGHAVAMAVAKNLVLFLRRSGNQAQFSEALKRQTLEVDPLGGVARFVIEHIHQPLTVERIARGIGTSARSLTRHCRQELGESPAALVRRLRLEHACRLLEESRAPLKLVAQRVGLADASTLYRLFTRHFRVSPAAYRERFAQQQV
ncbi:MAG TPA: helix-turn-helix domain-containing protein [Polyangiaceae bacterium]|nr:helix-turn-helix domain-containing protein [Polyangiaceae bacterium]